MWKILKWIRVALCFLYLFYINHLFVYSYMCSIYIRNIHIYLYYYFWRCGQASTKRQVVCIKWINKMQFLTSVLALLFVVKLWRTSHKTPIEYLRARYGQNLVKIFRIWEDLWRKSERFKLDLEFLESEKITNNSLCLRSP